MKSEENCTTKTCTSTAGLHMVHLVCFFSFFPYSSSSHGRFSLLHFVFTTCSHTFDTIKTVIHHCKQPPRSHPVIQRQLTQTCSQFLTLPLAPFMQSQIRAQGHALQLGNSITLLLHKHLFSNSNKQSFGCHQASGTQFY